MCLLKSAHWLCNSLNCHRLNICVISTQIKKQVVQGLPWWHSGSRIQRCHCSGLGSIPGLHIPWVQLKKKKKQNMISARPLCGHTPWSVQIVIRTCRSLLRTILLCVRSVSVFSAGNGYLSNCQMLAVIYNAALHIHVRVFPWMCGSVSLGSAPRNRVAGSHGEHIFSSGGCSQTLA